MLAENGLTLGGWVFMLVSCIATTGATIWCFWRVLTLPEKTAEPPAAPRPQPEDRAG